MNIKLESEPLEIECNPFNFSSGGTTGKKRRKKKDKEKKVSILCIDIDYMMHRDHRFHNLLTILTIIEIFAATWTAI